MARSERESTAKRIGWRLFLSGIAACAPVLGHAELEWWPVEMQARLSPLRVVGTSTYSIANKVAKGRRPNIDQMTMTDINISKMARGFLWRPWVLQWDAAAGVGVSTAQYTVFSAADGLQGGNDALSRRLEGSGTIYVLPESRFPFKAAYRRTQEDSSEGDPLARARIGDTFSLAQNYQNKEQDLTVAANAEHFQGRMGTKNISGAYGISFPSVDRYTDSTTLDTFSVSTQKRMLKQSVNALGRMVRGNHDTQDVGNSNQDIMFNVNHRYNEAKNWSVDTMGSINNARYEVDQHPRTGGAGRQAGSGIHHDVETGQLLYRLAIGGNARLCGGFVADG
ncbi:MAG: hypothetical protein H7836_06755 [Magnetococcus sp. YQC-3]